jgi:hypothetical protein
MPRSMAASCLVCSIALATVADLEAQAIGGRVVLDGWEEPVAQARVLLLDQEMTTVASVVAGEDGLFFLPAVEPGTYYLQAEHGGFFSAVSAAVAISSDGYVPQTVLTLPSPLLDLARRCFAVPREPGTGVLTGIAFEAVTEMPLPDARLRIQWERHGGPRGELITTADGAGRFVLCGVPAGTPVSAWAEALGGVTRVETDFVVTRDAIARLDLPIELGRVAPVRIVQTGHGEPDGHVLIQGRVVDEATGTPVAAAAVVLGRDGRQYVTDRQGRFRFEGVDPGQYAISVQGLGYELEPQPLELPEAASVELELRVSPQALAMTPLVVRLYSPEERTRRAMPHASRVIAADRLRFAETRGVPVQDLVRELPGVQVMEPGWYEVRRGAPAVYGPCIQSSRPAIIPIVRGTDTPETSQCQMVEVFLDGVAIGLAAEQLLTLPLMDLESVEFLHPFQAGQWGYEASLYGALVLWTRGRGPHADPARNERR